METFKSPREECLSDRTALPFQLSYLTFPVCLRTGVKVQTGDDEFNLVFLVFFKLAKRLGDGVRRMMTLSKDDFSFSIT